MINWQLIFDLKKQLLNRNIFYLSFYLVYKYLIYLAYYAVYDFEKLFQDLKDLLIKNLFPF